MKNKLLLIICCFFATTLDLYGQNPSNECNISTQVLTVQSGTSCATPVSGSTSGLTNSSYASSCAGTEDDDGFYQFVATSTSTMITVDGAANFDAVLTIDNNCNDASNILCLDETGSNGIESTVITTTIGSTYFIHIFDYSSNIFGDGSGDFTICLTQGPPNGSANCAAPTKLCTDGGPVTFNAPVGGALPPGNNYGCLGTATSSGPSWFYIQMQNSGSVDILLTAGSDVDFALWGPYASLAAANAACGSLPSPKDCSFSASATETINIPGTATAGQIYVLLITNYAAVAQTFTVSQTGGTGTTDCSNVLGACDISSIALSSITACNDNATASTTDDYYSATVTVTFANKPTTGTLDLTGAGIYSGTYSVAVASTTTATTHVFTNVLLKANGATGALAAAFSAKSTCNLNYTAAAVGPCSACASPPSVAITQSSVTICKGGTATFNYTVANGPATVTENGAGTASVASLPNGTSTFTYTAVAADAGTTVTVTATIDDPDGAGPCTASTDNVSVVVGNLSVTPVATPTSICLGASSSLSATSAGGTAPVGYAWNNSAGSGTPVSVSPASTTTYTVTATDANSCTATNTVSLTVNPLPTASISGTTSICSGSNTNISFTGTANATVTYTINGGANQTVTLSAAGAATVNTGALSSATTYALVSVTNGTCSQNVSGSAVISINPLPTATISGTTSICSGTSTNITFTGTANATVTYTVNGGANQVVALNAAGTATVNTGNLAANATYALVSITNGTCSQTLSGSAIVTVNSLPNATISGNTTICSGGNSNIVFTGTANATVTYTLNGTSQTVTLNAAGTATVNTGAISSTATYSLVSITNGTCSKALSGSAVVSINSLPTAAISGSTSICSGSNANVFFTGTANATVSYVLNGTPQTVTLNASGAATINTGAIAATAIYTLVSVANGTCSQNISGTAAITVNALPNATISGTTSICAGSNANITFSGTSGAIVTYNVNGGANQTVTLTGGTATVNTGALAATAIYDLVSVISGSCTKNLTGSATVTVNPLPTAIISGTTSVCSGGSSTITFSGTSGAIVTYNINGGANQTVTLTGGLATVNTGALAATATYNLVSITNGTCGQNLSGSAVVTVNPNPTTTYNVTGGGAYCAGGTGAVVGLSGSDLGVNYQLQVNGSNVGSVVAGTGVAISFGNQTTVGSYTVVATNGTTNCASSLTGGAVSISTNSLPTATINGSTAICSGSSANILFSGTSGAIVTYNDGTSNQTVTLTNGLATVNTGALNANVTYSLVSISDGTCSQNLVGSATVTVNPTPTATFTLTGGGAYCAGGTGVLVGLSGSDLGVNYQLQVNGSNVGAAVAGTGAAISFGNQTTVGNYTVVATNGTTNCISSLSGGVVTITTNPLPTATINGSTTICSGSSANILFSGTSGATVTYNDGTSNQTVTLTNGLATVNTGALNANITYSLVSVSDGTCSQNLVGSATVTVNPTPTATFTLTGGGAYCVGGTGILVGLSGSDLGVNYQLQANGSNVGAVVAGTGAAISFGNQTTVGSYTVVATNGTTNCTSSLTGGAVTITTNSLPTATINGSTTICAGSSANISFSGTSGATVTYNDGTSNQTVTLTNGLATVSTGALNANVTYTLVSVNDGTCSQNLVGSATVTVNPTPTATFTLTGGGAYCAGGTGVLVGLSGSDFGVNYQLQVNGSNVGAVVAGTGAAISFGNQTTVGSYTVVATNTTTNCISSLTGGAVTITTNPLPTATINGSTTICSGSSANISFSGTSGAIVTYNDGVSNQTITLTNGLATVNTVALNANVTYSLVSVSDGTCYQNLVGSATVTVNPTPTVTFTLTGGGAYCAGGTGVAIGLSGSDLGVNYQLQVNGSNVGAAVAGTGAAISFGNQTTVGSYTVVATNTTTNCTSSLTGGAVTITTNPLPTATINGSTTICAGSSVNISFSGTSGAIVTYNDGTSNQTVTLTNGLATVNTGALNANVTYSLVSISDGTCSQNLVGSATITVNPTPTTTYTLTGGGAYCAGGTGAVVGLSGSDLGVNYQLQVNGSNVGAVVAGTGAAISFGNQTTVGSYTVVATNGTTNCTSSLSGGVVTITTNPLPTATINGSTTICSGSSANISFSGTSGATVTYNDGVSNQTITLTNGLATVNTGALNANVTYSLLSVYDGTCSQNLVGNATITVNPTPITTYNVTGGGAYCAGGTGVLVGLSGSDLGVNYQLQVNGSNVGAVAAGTGAAISFGNQTTVGSYTVVATNATTNCTSSLSGGAVTISTNSLPTATINGSTTICSGSSANISFSGTSGAIVTYNDGTSNQTVTLTNGLATVNTGVLNANVTYTLVSVNDGTCSQNLVGSATVTVNPTPTTTYNVTGGGAYCAGGTGVLVGLSGSDFGVNYQLQVNGSNVGAVAAGTGAAISFGNQTTVGSYTVVATNATTNCTSSLTGGAVTITTNPLPTATINGSTTICSGSSANISFSGTSGAIVTYNDGTSNQTVTLTNGLATVNTGALNANVTYTLVSVNDGTCSQNLVGSAVVGINPLPLTSIAIRGGGIYCTGGLGVAIGLDSSEVGVNYQLLLNGVNTGAPVAGTGVSITFGFQTGVGTYTVVATNAITGCSITLSGSATVAVNSTPVAAISGTTAICAGDSANIILTGTPSASLIYNISTNPPFQNDTLIFPANGTVIFNTGALNADITYTLVDVSNGICNQPLIDAAVVTVNAAPNTTFTITGGGAYCAGGTGVTLGLSGSELNVDYQLQINGQNVGSPFSGTGNPLTFGTQTAAGIYTISATNTLTACASSNVGGNATVTVNPTPTASISGTATICAGDNTNITFSGTIGAIITYNVNGGANQIATLTNGSFILTVNPSTTTVYNLVSVALGSCSQNINTSATVTVNTLPTASISGNTSICSGANATISFTGTPNATVNYQVNGVAASILLSAAGTATVNGTALTSTNVYSLVDVTLGSCTQAVAGTATVTVNPTPTASISGTTTICAGDNTNITFSGTVGAIITYNVNGGANQTATLTNGSFILNVNPSITTVYNLVSVALGSCSQNINTSATVTVNTLPTASISGNTSICSGANATVSFTGTPNATVNYQVNGVAASLTLSAAGTATVNATALTSTNVYSLVDVTLGSCTQAVSGTTTVTVNPTPTASISGAATICAGDNTNITFSGTIGAIITYNVNGGANQTATLTNGSFILNVNPSITTIYNLVSVALGSCSQNINTSATVTVNTLPTASISGNTSICSGSNATVSFTGTPNATVNYQVNGVAASLTLSAAGTATVNATALTATNVYSLVDVTLGSCTQAVAGTATVTVNPTPTASISGTTTICAGDNADIIFSGTPNATVSYSMNGGAMLTITIGANGLAVMNTGPLFVPEICTLGSVSDGVCSQNLTGSVTVSVNPTPTASISGTTTICAGSNTTITFVGTPNAIVNYLENGVAGSVLLNGAGVATVNTNTVTANVVYSLVDATLGSCSQTLTGTATVTVNPTPTASVSGTISICSGSSANISFSGTIGATITYNVGGGANQTAVLTNGTFILNTTALTSTTVYNLISVSLNGCAQTINNSVTVTVNPSPTASISGTTAICAGGNANINFTGTPNATVAYSVNGNMQSLVLSAAGTATINTGAITANQVYSLSAVALGTCLQSVNGSATVTVNSTPTANISGTTAICSGSSTNITFSGTTGATITYNVGGGANQTAVLTNGTFILNTNALTSTTVYNLISVSLGAGCSQTINSSATVSVNVSPTATISGTTAICAGGNATISFTGTPNATVTYLMNGNTQSLVLGAAGTATINTGAISANEIYSLTNVTDGTCNQILTGSAVVTVNQLPMASISGGTSICAGNSANVSISGTNGAVVTYNVNGGANQTVTLTNGLAVLNTGALSASATYNLVDVSLAGCSQTLTGSATVNVSSTITVNAGTPQTVCSGGSVALNGTMGGGASLALWTAPTGSFVNATNLNATYIPSISSGVVTLTLTATDASGNCSAVATVNITVNVGQDAWFAYSATTYCQSSTLNPIPNIPTGNYSFATLSPGGALTINSITGEIDLQNSLPGTYQIFNILPSNGICPADTEYQFIIIERTPDASFQYDRQTYCGSQYPPIVLQNTGQQGSFSYIGTNTLTLNVSSGAIDLTTSAYGTYLITNTVNGLGTCPSDIDTFILTYVPKPTATITPSGTFDYCLVGNVNMQTSGGVAYQWLMNGQPVIGATNDTYTATQAGYYVAIAFNNEGCSDTSEVVVINAGNAPDASVKTNGSTTFCEGSSVTLSSAWLGNATYQWLRNGVPLSTNATQIVVNDGANYQLVVSNACGTDTSSFITTQIAATPIPNFSWSPEVIFKGQPVIFNDSSTNANTWSWYFGDGQIEYEENPTNIFYEAGEYTVYMQVRNSFGCDSAITKTLIVRNPGAYFIPNVFTPNGDGAFDTFQIEADGYEKIEVEIFDRWGVQLFETTDAKVQWDGNTRGGRTCQNGVYFYHVKITLYDGKVIEEKGNVTLLR